jgi:Ca2+-binding RTX toxin-like protein
MPLNFSLGTSVAINIGPYTPIDLDYLFPKAGITIYQTPGNFFTYGTDGSDTVYMNYSGILYAGSGNDAVYGWNTSAPLIIYGERGDDGIVGGWGNDYLDGGDHNDSIDGNTGNDRVIGGAGRDTLNGGNGNDYVEGGTGNDYLISGDSNYNRVIDDLMDTPAALSYRVNVFNTEAQAGRADYLVGGTGNDTFSVRGNNVFAVGGNADGSGNSGFDTFNCGWTTGEDNYIITIGNGGGYVDMRDMGEMTHHRQTSTLLSDGSYQIHDQFRFGDDSVIIVHNSNHYLNYDII